MDQPTFADLEFQNKKRKTRREVFLERIDGLIPWQRLEERNDPYYPKAGRGRRPYDLWVMVRIHCVQGLSPPLRGNQFYTPWPETALAPQSLAGNQLSTSKYS